MTQSKNKLSKKEKSGFLFLGSLIALLIGISPYIFYLYEIFPSSPVWENSFFRYESKYYLDVTTAAWTFLGKIVPLYLLFIWFFTCKHWWYHVILVPIIMYAYQLVNAVFQDAGREGEYIDTGDLLYLAPVVIVFLSFVYLVRIKIFDKVYGIDLSEIEEDDISIFSAVSRKDKNELDDFRERENVIQDPEEEYYKKL